MDLQPGKLKIVVFILIWTSLISLMNIENTIAQEGAGTAGTFLRMGAGARAMAMGGAFTGIANDPSATYWNPAGLEQIRNLRFEFMYMNMPFDRQFNFVSGVIPVKNLFTLGVSWRAFRINGIEGRNTNSAEPDYTFGNNQNAICVSIGKSIGSLLSVGGSVKIIKNDIEDISATGIGLDAALLLHPVEQVKLGLLVQDIGTDFRWNGGYTEAVPITLKFGISWRVYNGVILAADVSKTSGLKPVMHFGGELRLANSIPVRVGVNNNQISGGAGFILPFSDHSLEINYGYANDEVFSDAIHRVSLVFSFGSNSSRLRKRGRARNSGSVLSEIKADSRNAKNMIVVNTKVLNVRSGPGKQFGKVDQIQMGEKYEVFDKKGDWRKIKMKNGKMGWIHNDFVKIVRM